LCAKDFTARLGQSLTLLTVWVGFEQSPNFQDSNQPMPRYRTTTDSTATLVGKLLLLIVQGRETSATLAKKLNVSPRQINRYVVQLIEAGWQIERVGAWTKQDYWFVLTAPKVFVPTAAQERSKRGRK
jgi:hypothetical protein